jgi:hypothetical protein
MSPSEILLTKEDFEQSNWQTFIANVARQECLDYGSVFSEKAEEAKKSGDVRACRVFNLLWAITYAAQRLDLDNRRIAFSTNTEEERLDYPFSYIVGHLAVLEEIVYEISDPEMQARIADVVWTLQTHKRDASRDYQVGVLAVASYLKAARLLEERGCWRELVRRVKHAAHLARSHSNEPLATKTLDYIQSLLDRYSYTNPSFPFDQMMVILQQYESGDIVKNAALSQREALLAQEAGHWRGARRHWEIKAAWHKMKKDDDKRLESLRLAAETYVNEAEEATTRSPPSHFLATVFLNDAITGLERSGGSKERIEELKKKRAKYQAKIPGEMKVIEVREDISELTESAREHVKGKTPLTALCYLAFGITSCEFASLEDRVQENTEGSLKYLFPGMRVGKEGKTVGIRSSILTNDAHKKKNALTAKMLEQARFYQDFWTSAFIEPARKQINAEHSIQVRDILSIVSNNPFVPRCREMIFARGLQAGLIGDFLMAAHLLMPQLENSLRYLLIQQGLIVSGDHQRIQDEYSLGRILHDDPFASKLEEIVGKDILFDLQGLLVERWGLNLRNLIAHGLMDAEEFSISQVQYLWWLTLRLCISPQLSSSVFKE